MIDLFASIFIFRFFQKSYTNASYDGLWSKMPLGSLQKPAKSLPGPSQDPSGTLPGASGDPPGTLSGPPRTSPGAIIRPIRRAPG